MRTSSLSAVALLVVALGAAGPAAPAQAPAQSPAQAPTEPSPLVTELPDGPVAHLPEELCDKESLPAELEHLERLDGLGGPRSTARG